MFDRLSNRGPSLYSIRRQSNDRSPNDTTTLVSSTNIECVVMSSFESPSLHFKHQTVLGI